MRRLFLSTAIMVITTVAFAPTAVMAAKKTSPKKVNGAVTIDAKKAKQLFDKGVVFIDVRKDKDYAAGRVPDAIHIELKKVYSKDSLAKAAKMNQPVVIYCNGHSCMRSSKAAEKAVSWGYKNVYYFRDGFPSWKSSGYPVE